MTPGGVPPAQISDLPYDRTTGRVIRGVYRGLAVTVARQMEQEHLNGRYTLVQVQGANVRPWWRCWRQTPVLRLTASYPLPVEGT